MASAHSSSLNHNTDDEDPSGDDDTNLAAILFREESSQESADPGTKFEDGSQPSLPRLIGGIGGVVVTHVVHEVVHRQYPGEDTLVVAIEQAADASKAGYTEYSDVSDQSQGARVTHQGLTAVEGNIVCAGSSGDRSHACCQQSK